MNNEQIKLARLLYLHTLEHHACWNELNTKEEYEQLKLEFSQSNETVNRIKERIKWHSELIIKLIKIGNGRLSDPVIKHRMKLKELQKVMESKK